MPTFLFALVLILVSGADPAAQFGAASERDEFQRWLDFYTAQAAEYELFLEHDADAPLELVAQPVFHYSNPVRAGDQHGAVYLWIREGRPEIIGSIWSSVPLGESPPHRAVSHEFQSLAMSGIKSRHPPRVGRRGPVPDWQTSDPGVAFELLAGAPAPAATPALRLVQMKRLAAEFTATIDASDVEVQNDLRLAPQPLYRYASESAGTHDGALFAFMQATDPESLLLIEARTTPEGHRWHFAAARFTNRPLRLTRRGRDVWNCPRDEVYVSGKPYFLYWRVSEHDGVPHVP